MGRRLATAVHVQHPSSREWIVLEPGEEPDDDLTAEITNPDAWEDGEPPHTAEPSGEQEAGKEPFGFAPASDDSGGTDA